MTSKSKTTLIHYAKYILAGLIVGYVVGIAQVVTFESVDGGKNAKYTVCDDVDYDEGGEVCNSRSKAHSSLGNRAKSVGLNYAMGFAVIGFMIASIKEPTFKEKI